MTSVPGLPSDILRVAPFTAFVGRFDELLASSSRLAVYFIHSRRWRENHELMFSLQRHFDDGPLIPALVVDAYRYFARLAREYRKPAEVWLFGRYPTYTFYRFDDRAIVALYSNTAAKKDLPALEITTGGFFGEFLGSDIDDLKRECRRRVPEELEAVIHDSSSG